MRLTVHSIICGFLAVSITLFPSTSGAVLPVMFGPEILQNVIFGQVRNQMIGSLGNMGCKGHGLAGLIASAKAFTSPVSGFSRGMSGGFPSGMPGGGSGSMSGGGMNMPGPGMAMPNGIDSTAKSASMHAANANGIPTATEAQAEVVTANGMPDPAVLSQMMGRQMSPDQAAQMQRAMSAMQEAIRHPLSRSETIEVFDQLADMGLMTNEMRGEVRDCIMLAPPGSENAVGVSSAMVKTMVLPKLRDAKQRLNSLTPEEQSQLTDGIVDALQHASAKDRNQFLDGFGEGFFPAAVVEKVRAKINLN